MFVIFFILLSGCYFNNHKEITSKTLGVAIPDSIDDVKIRVKEITPGLKYPRVIFIQMSSGDSFKNELIEHFKLINAKQLVDTFGIIGGEFIKMHPISLLAQKKSVFPEWWPDSLNSVSADFITSIDAESIRPIQLDTIGSRLLLKEISSKIYILIECYSIYTNMDDWIQERRSKIEN